MGALAFLEFDKKGKDPIPQTWGTRVQIIQPNVQPARLVNIQLDPRGAPQTFAIVLSGNIGAGLGAPLYDISVGIGETNYWWRALAAPAPGAAYIVLAHSVVVDVYPANPAAGTEVAGHCAPSEAAPTLTP